MTIPRPWTSPGSAGHRPKCTCRFFSLPLESKGCKPTGSDTGFPMPSQTTRSAVLSTQGAAAAKRVRSPLTCGATHTACSVRLALGSLGFIVSAALFCTIAGTQNSPPEFSSERCRHPTTSLPAHHGILFVNNVKPSHFPVQFLLQ